MIDWGQVEDDIPTPESDEELECEVAALDFSKGLPSNLHPYYHRAKSNCCIIAHKCNCPTRRTVVIGKSLVRKIPDHRLTQPQW